MTRPYLVIPGRSRMDPEEIEFALNELAARITEERTHLPTLADRREAAGLTQAEVARAWICSKVYVSKVEKLPRPTPSTRAAYLAAIRKATQ